MKNTMVKQRKKIDNSILTLLALIVGIFVLMAILSPGSFYSWANVRSMIFQFPEFGIIALGVMLCMISGGIDLSLVGLANLAGIIAAYIILAMGGSNLGIVVGIVAGVAVGFGGGLFNGVLISSLNLPPMLVTLCGLQLFTGLGLGITSGPAVTGLPDNFKFIANGSIPLGSIEIPIVLFVFIGVLAVVVFIMRNTVFGHQIYFLGSNKEAAQYSGINCKKVIRMTYALSGALGAVAGIIMTSHFNSAKSDYGATYTLLSILIVVLGGVHPDGGRGKVLGVVLSVLLLQFITQMFTLLKIDTNWKTFTYGLLLIAALCITLFQAKYKERKAYKESIAEDRVN
ncbi:MAG TPA: ABC transporter permease [Clostridiales bacterium]|nr:ABC transporter permease [Clostridiales bacterium]